MMSRTSLFDAYRYSSDGRFKNAPYDIDVIWLFPRSLKTNGKRETTSSTYLVRRLNNTNEQCGILQNMGKDKGSMK